MNKIPKILHLYWDRSPMSWLQTLTIDTFIKYNPDWQIFVYLPNKPYTGGFSYVVEYTGKDFFSRVENNPHVTIVSINLNEYGIREDLHDILRSDILRYHLLYNIGGVWSDFDVIWLKPMFHLSKIVGRDDFATTICMLDNEDFPAIACILKDDVRYHYNIGILVSEARHPFYKSIIDRCNFTQVTFKGRPGHQDYGIAMLDTMFPNVNELLDKYSDVVKLDYTVFYPYSIFEMERLYAKTDLSLITNDVMCIHWFNGHPLSKEYVNNNDFNKKCSMTEIIRQVKRSGVGL